MATSQFPSNSNKAPNPIDKSAAKPEKKIERVTSAPAVRRKKNVGRRLSENITGTDSRTVAEHVVFSVALPALKDLIFEVFTEGMHQKLFGNDVSRARVGRQIAGKTSKISYESVSKKKPLGVGNNQERVISRVRGDVDDIFLETRAEALEVIERMYDLLSTYGLVTVADLYGLVGQSAAFTDERRGWDDLRGADVRHHRDGYMLVLPRPSSID